MGKTGKGIPLKHMQNFNTLHLSSSALWWSGSMSPVPSNHRAPFKESVLSFFTIHNLNDITIYYLDLGVKHQGKI